MPLPARSTSTSPGWLLPSTTAGVVTSSTVTSGAVPTGVTRPCSADARPTRRSTAHPADVRVGPGPQAGIGTSAGRKGVQVVGTRLTDSVIQLIAGGAAGGRGSRSEVSAR